ncbi:hypothetical protein AAGG74_18250 [Bacillus mexicanus]|uniref:hypothetical protein n=1 Tax=Bacillus mexicanus TaxID=2834415 RepID=UPI003D20FD11
MEKKTFGQNRGIWCGKVVEGPVFNHELRDRETQELIEEYYVVQLEVEFENAKKTVTDVSVLPVLITKSKLDALGDVKEGDLLFVRGEYRAYDRRDEENNKKRTITTILSKKVEKVTDYTRTRNKIEFHGILKSKIYKVKFDENGVIEKDEKGKPVPVLDEDGNKIPAVRRNTEGKTVNDFILQVPKQIFENEEVKTIANDYIPMIAYGSAAWQIAQEIDVNTKVMARGYVRRRAKNGFEGEWVYEPVITRITPIKESEEGLEAQTE